MTMRLLENVIYHLIARPSTARGMMEEAQGQAGLWEGFDSMNRLGLTASKDPLRCRACTVEDGLFGRLHEGACLQPDIAFNMFLNYFKFYLLMKTFGYSISIVLFCKHADLIIWIPTASLSEGQH